MTGKWRPTLRQVFALSLLGLLLGLGLLFYLGVSGSESTTLKSAENYRELASRFIAARVTRYLDQAPAAVDHFEDQIHYGVIDFSKKASVQQGLLSLLLANENISEATLTYADSEGFASNGDRRIDSTTAGQIAIVRKADGHFVRRLTWFDSGKFVAVSDLLMPDSPAQPMPTSIVPDPTQHLTFQTAARQQIHGALISTDLHWAQLDEGLPESQRRVEVSVQKVVSDKHGNFAGVLRVGLLAKKIGDAVEQHITAKGQPDQHLIFLCDADGRLITGFAGDDDVTVVGYDLRIPVQGAPDVVRRALQEPALKTVDDENLRASSSFSYHGMTYLCSFQYLPNTQDWIVGIVVPRDFYLGDIIRTRNMIFWTALVIIALIVLAGSLILQSVSRAQSLVRMETGRMNRFEFSPSRNTSSLRDVQEVLGGLERAKTAMRAMSKYVPVKLVRQLYRDGEEPTLGACPAELSVLFTDIRDFTAIAESTPPARLAEILGRYLQVMATVIQNEKGTIDKYIGDSVMVFWNAPEQVTEHEILACRTALRCRDALKKLYAMPEWGDAPRFETRFGLHRCQASVGHFGSPDRFNYTAIGDGINLTSRLESLNKHYGTTIIASETIAAAAKGRFEFRLLDRVAVKGKTQGITIYELISERLTEHPQSHIIERYERAFASYQRGDFAGAIPVLNQQPDDPPSAVLLERCRELSAHPPKAWTGIYAFHTK
jgi:adenylate cyclase